MVPEDELSKLSGVLLILDIENVLIVRHWVALAQDRHDLIESGIVIVEAAILRFNF
jgi:hypothetical protein